jgi:hypothetical protein
VRQPYTPFNMSPSTDLPRTVGRIHIACFLIAQASTSINHVLLVPALSNVCYIRVIHCNLAAGNAIRPLSV